MAPAKPPTHARRSGGIIKPPVANTNASSGEPRRLPRALVKPLPAPAVTAKGAPAAPLESDPRLFFERLHTAAGEAHSAWAAGDKLNARWAVLRVRELLDGMDDSLFGIALPDVDDLDTDMSLQAVELPERTRAPVRLPHSTRHLEFKVQRFCLQTYQ